MNMPSRPLFQATAVAAGLALAGLVPTTAHAATAASVSGPQLSVIAGAGETNVVSLADLGSNQYTVTDTGGTPLAAGGGCVSQTASQVLCTIPSLHDVSVDLNDGNDSLTDAILSPLSALGGAGNDILTGPDTWFSSLDGGTGDDTLTPGNGIGDHLIGGAGHDIVSYASRTVPVKLTNDGGYSSGVAGEYDSIESDVEELIGGSGNDTLHGGAGNDVLRGGAGDDKLDGADGDDQLFGDQGNDTLDGRVGNDVVDGGAGDDAITSRDSGQADTVDCGVGNDTVTGDREDTFAGCETIDVPPLPPSPEPVVVTKEVPVDHEVFVDRPVDRPVDRTVEATPGAPVVVTITQREFIYDAAMGVVAVKVSCGADQSRGCSGTVSIAVPAPKSAHKASVARRGVKPAKPIVVAKTTFKLKRGESKVIKAKASRRGVKQAFGDVSKAQAKAKTPKRKVKAVMTISTKGSDGSRTTVVKPVTVSVPGRAR